MDKSLEKLNELKKQEELMKKLIFNLESQKQKLEIEELDLMNTIDKETNSKSQVNNSKSSIQHYQCDYLSIDLNLDPNVKQKFHHEQFEEEEEEE